MKRAFLLIGLFAVVAGCTQQRAAETEAQDKVETSGKKSVAVADVPEAVIAAARERLPDLTIAEAEAETRESRRYFDIGGTLPDGSEVELDIMEEGGRWRVVEVQRDIAFGTAPQAVRDAALAHDPQLSPSRVIESRQEDGLVIYEVYAPADGNPQGRKLEVKWDGTAAELLQQEWAH